MKRYSIITNGRPIKGHEPGDVLRNLEALFKTPPEKTRQLLAGRVMTLRKGLDEPAAKRMLAALRQAGLICKAEPESTGPPVTEPRVSPQTGGQGSVAPQGAQPDVRAAMGARSMDPEMGAIKIEHTALPTGEITSSAQGLDFHKPGATDVPFSEILMMAVYEVPSPHGGEIKLMAFISGSRRPLTLNANSIKYWHFKGISSQSAGLSLRQFIAYVYAHKPSLILDTPTVGYLDGALPRQLKLDESILSSAIGRELAAKGLFAEPSAAIAGMGPDMSGMLDTLKTASAEDPSLVAKNRARLAMGATALSVGYALWALWGQLRLLGSYEAYFSAGRHPLVNHMLMWTSFIALAMLLTFAAVVMSTIRKRSENAQGTFMLYAWVFGAFSIVHFVLLAGIGMGLRRGIIWGKYALFSLPQVITSKQLVLKALLISPAAIAIPLAAALVHLFSRSWEVKSRFRG